MGLQSSVGERARSKEEFLEWSPHHTTSPMYHREQVTEALARLTHSVSHSTKRSNNKGKTQSLIHKVRI